MNDAIRWDAVEPVRWVVKSGYEMGITHLYGRVGSWRVRVPAMEEFDRIFGIAEVSWEGCRRQIGTAPIPKMSVGFLNFYPFVNSSFWIKSGDPRLFLTSFGGARRMKKYFLSQMKYAEDKKTT